MKSSLGILSVVVVALFVCAQCEFRAGMKTGLRAPKLVYSCTVRNDYPGIVDVEVRYTHPFENRIVVDRATLAHGEQKFFDRRDFQNVDKTSFAAVVSDVVVKDVTNPEKEVTLGKDQFNIYSPTADYKIHVVAADSPAGFELQHGANL